MFDKEDLIKLAKMKMPFGKYQGRVLIDLPEEYLLWFSKKRLSGRAVGPFAQALTGSSYSWLDPHYQAIEEVYARLAFGSVSNHSR